MQRSPTPIKSLHERHCVKPCKERSFVTVREEEDPNRLELNHLDDAFSSGRTEQLRMCGLTFELSGRQRQDARARTEKMYRVPQAGPWWPAVGAPLERGVRPQWLDAAHDYPFVLAMTMTGMPGGGISSLTERHFVALGSTHVLGLRCSLATHSGR